MTSGRRLRGLALAAISALVVVVATVPAEAQNLDSFVVVDQAAGTVTYTIPDLDPVVIADGLVNPRGLAMSPDGNILVVAESGDGPGQGRLVGIRPNLEVTVLVDGLNFPEGVAFVDDTTLYVSSVPDQTISEYVLGDSEVRPLIQLLSPPTGMVTVPVGPEGGVPPVAVSTWNGLGLIFENGDISPFTDLLAGGGHPGFSPDLGVCFPEYDQNRVSCWPLDGGEPQTLPGFDQPVGVVILPSGLLAVADASGVHLVDPRDGSVLFTEPFDNPAAMVVPGDRDRVWLPALRPETPSTTSVTTTSVTTAEAPPTTNTTATTSPSASAPTPAPSPEATSPAGQSEVPAGTHGGGSSSGWWWLVAIIPAILAAVAVMARRQTGADNTPEPPEPMPSPVASVDDPCKDLCEAARKASADAERAKAEAEAAENSADEAKRQADAATSRSEQADKDAARAKHDTERADRDVDRARDPSEHSGGRAKSGDREYTGADSDRVKAESDRIDNATAAGDMTMQEAQAEKAKLRTPEKWKELREKEESDRRKRIADAERKSDQARKTQQQAEDDARRAHSDADASHRDAQAKREAAGSARARADKARSEAEAKREACERCRRDAAIEAAGGADSWKVAQGRVGEPCHDGDARETISQTETFYVSDESRPVEVADESIRPSRISAEDRGFIRGVFSKVGHLLGIVSMIRAVPLVFKIPMKYLSFMSKGSASILDDLDAALEKAKRPGGLSDYYFVKVTIPRRKVTVTCTCTVECRNGVRTCVGCVSNDTSEPGDLVDTSEGTRAEVEKFIAGMQARAATAQRQDELRKAFEDACSCS